MVVFECPHCGAVEYSAYESPEHEGVTCTVCGKQYRNPYYRPYFGRRNISEITQIKATKLQGC